jgi:hypothetical protein
MQDMTRIRDRTIARLQRFWRRDDGIMAAELVVVLPVFLFCTLGMYTYWDAFRSLNTLQKATYTVSDMIARTMQPVNGPYIEGLRDTLQYMVGDKLPVTMRVSSVTWSAARNRYEIKWSRSPSEALPRLTTATLQVLANQIPILSDGDTVIIVESNSRFRPIFARMELAGMLLEAQDFQQFIVTRPRFVPQVCLTGVECS